LGRAIPENLGNLLPLDAAGVFGSKALRSRQASTHR
jgi:hypothetical protein